MRLKEPLYRATLVVAALAAVACSSRAGGPPTPRPAAGTLYERVPDRVGDFALTERAAVVGLPSDSVFRFSDGSATRLSVILYDAGADVKADPDPQTWTAGEGEKFRVVQEVRRRRGDIAGYVVAFTDTNSVAAGDGEIVEHSAAVPVRSRNGAVSVELQYLYLIDGKFVKVRATVPEQGWQRTKVPAFARELAGRLAR